MFSHVTKITASKKHAICWEIIADFETLACFCGLLHFLIGGRSRFEARWF
jgi:hypothetical protein